MSDEKEKVTGNPGETVIMPDTREETEAALQGLGGAERTEPEKDRRFSAMCYCPAPPESYPRTVKIRRRNAKNTGDGSKDGDGKKENKED